MSPMDTVCDCPQSDAAITIDECNACYQKSFAALIQVRSVLADMLSPNKVASITCNYLSPNPLPDSFFKTVSASNGNQLAVMTSKLLPLLLSYLASTDSVVGVKGLPGVGKSFAAAELVVLLRASRVPLDGFSNKFSSLSYADVCPEDKAQYQYRVLYLTSAAILSGEGACQRFLNEVIYMLAPDLCPPGNTPTEELTAKQKRFIFSKSVRAHTIVIFLLDS